VSSAGSLGPSCFTHLNKPQLTVLVTVFHQPPVKLVMEVTGTGNNQCCRKLASGHYSSTWIDQSHLLMSHL
jgi:hypothetical protein